ncbi:putative uroporphyrin-III c-methyltransferase [Yersinia enterocolitica]|nr:putative uroporphyrin-III c-methyltransferase [Yersinia enterocolitica]
MVPSAFGLARICHTLSAQLNNSTAWEPLLAVLKQQPITLLYGSRDEQNNQAVVLRDFLLSKL